MTFWWFRVSLGQLFDRYYIDNLAYGVGLAFQEYASFEAYL
jgi:hypothetical protein